MEDNAYEEMIREKTAKKQIIMSDKEIELVGRYRKILGRRI